MVDVVDKATRSRMMSSIRGKDTKPELLVRKALHARGFRFRLHVKELPGKPDLIFPKYRAVVFVQGCFWHRHQFCKYAAVPKSNAEFWAQKLDANRSRDLLHEQQLKKLGWRVFAIWECEVDEFHLAQLAENLLMNSDDESAT
jgi:DNA mismatch endonuclease (patch repair protein)